MRCNNRTRLDAESTELYLCTHAGQDDVSVMLLRPRFQRGKQSQRVGKRLPRRFPPRNDMCPWTLSPARLNGYTVRGISVAEKRGNVQGSPPSAEIYEFF